WQRCNDCRLACLSGSMQAGLDRANLASRNDPADYGSLPVIVKRNQSPTAIVQFQCRIGQCMWNVEWRRTELRTNRTDTHRLWSTSPNNKAANHHVVTRLHKAPSADVTQRHSIQVITDNIQIDSFRRCRGDIGRLPGAGKSILHIWTWLRARIAQPLHEIAV